MNVGTKRAVAGYLFVLPAISGFLIWTLGPMIASLLISLTDWSILDKPSWIGLDNYRDIFTTDLFFGKSLFVTFYYAIGSVCVTIVWSFLLALLLNSKVKGIPVFRTFFYLPTIVPAVASSILWLWLFNPDFGLLNAALSLVGLPKQAWIFDEATVIPSLILMSAWGAGNTMIIFLAGLQGVPAQLYESVEIDGGRWWHKLVHITLPLTTNVIFFNLVMGLIGAFQVFTEAFIMTQGGPNNGSLFYSYYLYRTAFKDNQLGYASALAWILFLIIASFTALVFRTSRSWVYYEGGERK